MKPVIIYFHFDSAMMAVTVRRFSHSKYFAASFAKYTPRVMSTAYSTVTLEQYTDNVLCSSTSCHSTGLYIMYSGSSKVGHSPFQEAFVRLPS